MKKKDQEASKVKELLQRLRGPLEAERPLRTVDISPDDDKRLRSYPLLSRREMIVVLNVSDNDIADTGRLDEMRARYSDSRIRFVQVAARAELEIAALETESERVEFREEMGITDTALHMLTQQCIEALGLTSFFTVGPKEVHHWFVRDGSDAVEAAGKIHSDLARGFIRAEVIKHEDLVALGSEEEVKSAGKLAVKGRDYIVEDGDILFIRFNV
jgi:ribosome-binding ATPase YchF (GTP1/OBG family)